MTNKTKIMSFVFAAGIVNVICPSLASAVVIYSNGFESGLQPSDEFSAEASNGYCGQGGTNPLLSHTGCPPVVPTSSINAGTGSFVVFADPNQTRGGTTVRGSALGLLPIPLVD